MADKASEQSLQDLPPDIEEVRTRLIRGFSGVAALVLLVFAVISAYYGLYLRACLNAIICLTCVWVYISQRRHRNAERSAALGLFSMVVLLLSVVIDGGTAQQGLFWIYTFPLVAFFLTGKERGITWVMIFACSLAWVLVLNELDVVKISYQPVTVVSALITLVVVTVLVYLYESYREASALRVRNYAQELLTINEQLSEQIAERNRLNNAMQRFQEALDETVDLIFMFDVSTGELVYANRGAVAATGYPRQELLGMQPEDLDRSLQVSSQVEVFRSLLDLKRPSQTYETELTRKDGSTFPVETTIQRVDTGEGEVVYIAIARNISERRVFERMKSQFIATVSHEIRTPLTCINGSITLLNEECKQADLSDQQRQLLDIAHKNSLRLEQLVSDILELQTLESDALAMNQERLEVAGFVRQLLADKFPAHDHPSIELVVSELPADTFIYADSLLLGRALSNVLANAFKFSSPGGQVNLQIDKTDTHTKFSIQDQGPGIATDKRDLIFEKFALGDGSDARANEGAGLGLSLAKQIVERLSGRIYFDSLLGKGTVFHIELPNAPTLELESPAD